VRRWDIIQYSDKVLGEWHWSLTDCLLLCGKCLERGSRRKQRETPAHVYIQGSEDGDLDGSRGKAREHCTCGCPLKMASAALLMGRIWRK
jgi:hypothetical protein